MIQQEVEQVTNLCKDVREISNIDYLNSTQFISELNRFLQKHTDIPLLTKFKLSDSSKTFCIKIFPQLTFQDFENSKFKKWEFSHDNHDVERKVGEKFNFSNYLPYNKLSKLSFYIPDIFIKAEIVWPREIGTFVVEQNEKFREKFSSEFLDKYGFQIEYGITSQNPRILVGVQYDHQYNLKERTYIKKIQKLIFKNSELIFLHNGYWSTYNKYSYNDKNYWPKTQLFDYFLSEVNKVHGKTYEYDITNFIDLETPMKIFCSKHQQNFLITPSEHVKGKRCPLDNESTGEKLVRIFLEKKEISFKPYYRFKSCFSESNGRTYTLPFDFYLPTHNVLIEYDGEQHFKPVDIWGGETGFCRQQILDSIKNKFAEDNNIKLIRIPFTVKKEFQLIDYLSNKIIGLE